MSDLSAPPPPSRPTDPKRSAFGKALRAAREQHRLTMVDVANALHRDGLQPGDVAHVSDVELGYADAELFNLSQLTHVLRLFIIAGGRGWTEAQRFELLQLWVICAEARHAH